MTFTRTAASSLVVLLSPAAAGAFVAPEEAIPQRSLVLGSGEYQLAGGAHLLILGEGEGEATVTGEPGFQDYLLVPLSGAMSLGERWELGLSVDTTLRPSFALVLTPRCRFALDEARRLAVGLAVTLPLGYLTYRLGPEGLPLRLELPALRLENSRAALRAGLLFGYHLQAGDDASSLALDAAGVVSIAGPVFAVAHLGLSAPQFRVGDMAVGVGLGLGWLMTQRFIGKIEAWTLDLGTLVTWQVAISFSTTLETLSKSPDDWL
jgi:hypothetical protein